MTEKQAKQYEVDCKKSGNLDYPLAGCIKTPICMICKNYVPIDRYSISPKCLATNADVPVDYRACWSYACEHFIHDSESEDNRFFDENHKPLRR